MHRPEDLFDTVEYDAIAGLFTRMIRGETTVIGRMPILCGKNQRETLLQFVGQRNDFVTVRDRQRPAGQKIVLKIDNDQRIHSTRSRCSFAREINLDLNSCSEFSRPTPYRRGFSNFKISGGEQLSCRPARSRDAWIDGTRQTRFPWRKIGTSKSEYSVAAGISLRAFVRTSTITQG